MTPKTTLMRAAGALVLAAVVLAAAAPAAEAGHGKNRRYKAKHGCAAPTYHAYPRVKHDYDYKFSYKYKIKHAPRPVYIERHYGPAPVLAGFLGGLVVGAAIGNVPAPEYAYFDPYCGERFVSLEVYRRHLGHHHHPRVIHVIEIRTGRWVDSYHYDRAWRHWDEDWDDYDD